MIAIIRLQFGKVLFSSETFDSAQKWGFPLMTSSVNMTKSAVSCGLHHIYWKILNGNFIFSAVWAPQLHDHMSGISMPCLIATNPSTLAEKDVFEVRQGRKFHNFSVTVFVTPSNVTPSKFTLFSRVNSALSQAGTVQPNLDLSLGFTVSQKNFIVYYICYFEFFLSTSTSLNRFYSFL